MLDAHIPIFKGELINLDVNQSNLLYWLKFYYNHIFSKDSTERPNDFVVGCDALLDAWLEKKSFDEKMKTDGRPRASAQEMDTVINFG